MDVQMYYCHNSVKCQGIVGYPVCF